MTLTQRLSLIWRRFSPLEERLLATIRDVLPPDARPVFDAQVGAITHVQRLPDWTEIDYYPRKLGKVDWSNVPRFPLTGEFPLARVHFGARGRRYRATLSCIDSHIFDFGITPSPKSVAFADWDSAPNAELLADPLRAGRAGWAEAIPDAWRHVLETMAPEAETTGWTFHDAHTARRITLNEGEFLVLAERAGDEFIFQRTEPPSTFMFFLASHDGTPEVVSGSIGELLKRPMRNA
jgi:hypothetical protein